MDTVELLKNEMADAPEVVLREVYHYLRYLKEHANGDNFNGLAWSHSSLAKDWNTPEEDKAWANL